MALFAMMSLLTELGILTERFFYKYSAPHGAYGAKTARGAAQERQLREALMTDRHFNQIGFSVHPARARGKRFNASTF